jgi:two-component system, NtrC family, response regulator AtoC
MPRTHSTPRILVAEDDPEVRGFLDVALRSSDFLVDLVEDGEEALVSLKGNGAGYALLLMDLIMPRKDGLETLREIRQFDTGLPIIMLSRASSPLHVVDAIKSGANDFLSKPVNHEDLIRAIQKALRIRPEADVTSSAAESTPTFEDACIASSSWSKKLDLFLRQVGSSEVPVLLQGETGVGKEVLARQLHACSPRAKKPLLKLNCAALPSELIESELFGYERGAFTGAFRSSPGKFEAANGGTILLDEIGDMDFKLQAKLLQVVQDGEFLRLGGAEVCRVDVRVIAATHCNLEQAIADGRFREDLYYRLNIIRIEVPPLRDRKEEILPLAQFFIKKHSKPGDAPMELGSGVRQTLLDHSWPGNIRELENVIRKMVVVRRPELAVEDLRRGVIQRQTSVVRAASLNDHRWTDELKTESSQKTAPTLSDERRGASSNRTAYTEVSLINAFPAEIDDAGSKGPGQTSILRKVDQARKQAEIEAIVAALNASLWNRKEAARLLNVESKALLYKMKKLGIGEKMLRVATS